MTAAAKTETPKIFRITLEVSNIDEAAAFYAKLLGTKGKRHPGAAVHTRARDLKALAPYKVHGEPAGTVTKRPWGERSFYVVDSWGNDLCFVEEGTLYT